MAAIESLASILAVNMDYILEKVTVDANLYYSKSQALRPVIRVFGSTELGQRACMYVHGVYPYMFFRPESPKHPVFDSIQKVQKFLPILECSLEDILLAKLRSSTAGKSSYSGKRKRIYRLDVVSMYSMYGMWMDPMLFIKVTLFDPRDVLRLANILNEGPLAGIQMQTYESHIPYLLQFTSTFNISPMGWIHVRNAKFRPPLPDAIAVVSTDASNNSKEVYPNVEAAPNEDDFKTPASASSSQLRIPDKSLPSAEKSVSWSNDKKVVGTDGCSTEFKKYLCVGSVESCHIWSRKELGLLEEPEIATDVPKINAEDQAEIDKLMEGITSQDLLFSQIVQPPKVELTKSHAPRQQTNPMKKVSTCDLEFDVHASHILNAEMPKNGFGAELWEEERVRCASKGLEMERAPLHPFTQTMHREPSENELDFLARFKKLQMKGWALKKQAHKKLQELDKSKKVKKNIHVEDVLSQFFQPGEDIPESPQELHNEHTNTIRGHLFPHFDPDSWAEEAIQDSIKQANLQESLLDSYITESDSIVEEYVRTQHSQPAETHNSQINKELLENLKGNEFMEDDEGNENESQQELHDILRSTQADPSETENPARADFTSKVISHNTQTRGIAMSDSSSLEAVYLIDGTPSPKRFEINLSSAYNDSPGVEPDRLFRVDSLLTTPLSSHQKVPQGSMGSNLNAESFEDFLNSHPKSIPPAGSARRLRLSQNDLVSVFRKRKREDIDVELSSQEQVEYAPSSQLASSMMKKYDSIVLSKPLDGSASSKSVKRKSVSFTIPAKSDSIPTPSSFSEEEEIFSLPRKRLWPENTISHSVDTKSAKTEREYVPLLEQDKPIFKVDKNIPSSGAMFLPTDASSIRLIPTIIPPSWSVVASMGMDSNDDLSYVLNTPAFFSKMRDAVFHKQSGLQAQQNIDYHAFMMGRHDIRHSKDVKSFFSLESTASFPVGPPDRVRCLIPTFSPPVLMSLPNDAEDDNMGAFENSCKSYLLSSSAYKETKKSWVKSQIATPTQTPGKSPMTNSADSKGKTKLGTAGNSKETMTRLIMLSMELFCCTRKELLPNPKYDAVQMLVWCATDVMNNAEDEIVNRCQGILMWVPPFLQNNSATSSSSAIATNENDILRQWHVNVSSCSLLPQDAKIEILQTEEELFERFFVIAKELDPDFLVGYENQHQSFGYFIKRGIVLGKDALRHLSRLPKEKPSFRNDSIYLLPQQKEDANRATRENVVEGEEAELPGFDRDIKDQQDDVVEDGDPGIFIKGRTIMNNWQLMKSELKLSDSTIQYVAGEVLKVSFPFFSPAQLTRWFCSSTQRFRTVQYVFMLAYLNIMLLEKLDMIRKISESARLYGIDFYSVIHRGSQYRVEAALLSRARSLNFVMLSPSRNKVASQSPMEVIPLVMEPQSRFFHDPVLVLDFQSLYPSMMIAHNLCFSTCMGKLRPGVSGEEDTTGKLGVISYPEKTSAMYSVYHSRAAESKSMDSNSLSDSNTSLPDGRSTPPGPVCAGEVNAPYVSPNGSLFCSKVIRQGILPLMLKEMLNTRVMVKRAMKRHASGERASSVLGKVLDARQLAIKLLSNVTYGYTAAGFSGRMPMAELADAIVQSGRSLLEWSMERIRSHPTWKAEVVYGDTDSIFIHLQGRTLQQAFQIGEEIAKDITSKTPEEVVLKFEKVYFPCILVTKKRYVGNCFESVDQVEPHLDAKGIEVIRRDQCPATQKIQEKVLRLLFTTRDMSLVKEYLHAQWTKMLMGSDKLLIRDFIFCKEVRFGHYASVSSQPPGAIVATKAVLADEMAVPPYNWRVPYVVVHGLPNALLKQLVYDPKEVLRRGSNLRINYVYYITKCINPALDRVLSLCGVNVFQWYRALVRPKPRIRHIHYDQYMSDRSDGSKDPPQSETIRTGAHRYRQQMQGVQYQNVETNSRKRHQMTMDQFTVQATCEICAQDALPQKNLCQQCLSNQMDSLILLTQRLNMTQEQDSILAYQCHACAGFLQEAQLFLKGGLIANDGCSALDCAIFHERTRLVTRMEDFTLAMGIIEKQE